MNSFSKWNKPEGKDKYSLIPLKWSIRSGHIHQDREEKGNFQELVEEKSSAGIPSPPQILYSEIITGAFDIFSEIVILFTFFFNIDYGS